MVVKMTRAEYEAKYGAAPAVSSTPVTPAVPVTKSTPVKMSRAEYQTKYGTAPATPEPAKKGWVGEMAKGLISAPATMIARPIQLGAELLMPGDNTEAIDRFSREKLGGIVAPVPQSGADVKKDIGRGIETVALGLTPVAGGAAFGLGGSLEQGNDLFSLQTALQGTVGALAAPLIGKIGTPILNTAGKVVGKVTGPYIKQLASKGARAVEKWMAEQELLGGAAKGLSEKITAGSKAIDTGAGKLFTGAKQKAGEAITTWQPGLSKDAITKRFEKIEQESLLKPTKEVSASYSKAKEKFKEAQNKGIDIGKVATDNKIYAKDLVQDGKYNTQDTVDLLRKETMSKGPDLLRPALREAQPGVKLVPIDEVRNSLISDIKSLSKSKITDNERQSLINKVMKDYGPGSAAEQAHPNGYNLEDLLDSKISSSSNVKYGTWGQALSFDDTLTNAYNKRQSSVFKKLLEKNAPKEIGVPEFNKKLQERFTLADYLEELNGKKAPQSLFQGALRTGAKVSGAALGGATGNVFGAFGGYHAGGMAMDSFMNASNPVKAAYLKEVQAIEPEIFNAIREYIGDQQVARLMRLQLPAPSSKVSPELMKMQNKQGAVEMGYTPKKITPGQSMVNDFNQNKRIFGNTPLLSAPTNRTIVPNTQGTPNQPGVYPGTPEVGGMRQRIFRK